MGTIPSWAVKGAKVVCVDDSPGRFHGPGIVRGVVYTISDVYFGEMALETCVTLVEFGSEHGFRLRRFRPTRTIEQDVSRFRKHLRTKRTRTDAFVKIPHLGEVS